MLASDLRAAARLATHATDGVSRIAEGLHQAIWSTLGVGPADGRTRGLTGFVYRRVRGTAQLAGSAADAALGWFDRGEKTSPESTRRAATLAALNGVIGDHLAATGNPLATPMTLRHRGVVLPADGVLEVPGATGRPVLFLHGLCMDEHGWRPGPTASAPYGALLADAGATPLFLRYNSGLPVAENGRRLADLLESVLARWPLPLDHFDAVAHSMGGLVLRSALHAGRAAGHVWPERLRAAVFLGTPHHGAPLERAGNGLDTLLGATRYSAPFARIGMLRSAGITDLRHGRVAGPPPPDRFRRGPDPRPPLPLPDGVRCYAVAAALPPSPKPFTDQTLGDGLVPIDSALGRHADPARRLAFDASRTLHGTGHFALLHHPEVADLLAGWLA